MHSLATAFTRSRNTADRHSGPLRIRPVGSAAKRTSKGAEVTKNSLSCLNGTGKRALCLRSDEVDGFQVE